MMKPVDVKTAADRRRSLLLTTAVVTLVSAIAGARPAYAQQVTGNGVNPGGIGPQNWAVGGDLEVGTNPGAGWLKIEDGGTVTNNNAFVGNGASDQGEVTVSGHDGSGNASTWTSNGDLVIGKDGKGTLAITNGGVVRNDGWGFVGAEFDSRGDVTVSGRDANGNASTWTSSGQLFLGESGTGTLTIVNGGVVNSPSAVIGNSSDGFGTVTVSGHDADGNASTWNNNNQLYVGDDGTGSLSIRDGGLVNSGQGLIGYGAGTGSVTVSDRDANGRASTWNAANNIYVGFGGDGTLAVIDGAAVATSASGGGAASIYIGKNAGSKGSVTVSSSNGSVSSLTATDRIEVGLDGDGTMTVAEGGFVSAATSVHLADGVGSGELHIEGDATGRGILETGSVVRGTGASAVLDLDGGILRANRNQLNFLNGFTTLAVGGEGAWFDTNGYDIAIGTDFSGSSSFHKLGLGQLKLTGDSSGFTGASTVSAGTLAVNGTLGGDMLIDTAGRLVGIGRVGNVDNKGVIAPGYGGALGTLTVQGDYVGNGGRLEITSVLGDDSSQTSRLLVDGSTSGLTHVTVTNRGGTGAQTVEGIKIIDVAGASGGSFLLDGNYLFEGDQAVIAGAYAYRLYQGGISSPADGDWYLRSTLVSTGTPLYQPGVPIYEAYGANLQSLNALPTLQQRVGNRFWEADADGNGFWGRMEGAHGRFSNAPVSTTGMDHRIDTWKMQIGADGVLAETDTGGHLVAGLNLSYGAADSRIRSAFGDGALRSEGYGLGATLTWYDGAGFYADAQAQLGRYDSDLTSDLLGLLTQGNGGHGGAFSVETGKRISLNDELGITPQFQMVYSNVRFDGFVDPAGTNVRIGSADSLRTRAGVAFDYQDAWDGGHSRLYGIANVNYEWLDGTRTLVAGLPVKHADERFTGELGFGASVNWDRNLTLYGEVSGSTPLSGFGKSHVLKGNLGLRAQF